MTDRSSSPRFGKFRLDLGDEQLWNRSRRVDLTPKAWAVLRYLAERPGQLVTKAQLLDAVWADVSVGEGSLTRAIAELRSALGDTAQTPRFIQTVHRRGFRFIAPLETAGEPQAQSLGSRALTAAEPARRTASGLPYIGRGPELQQLQAWFELAAHGQRQTVFVIGEPGIGKTALVDAFVASLGADASKVWTASGQCIEQYGPREAFMPVLEALGRLCRQDGGERFVAVLRQHAPTWLTEIPGLLDQRERAALQRETAPVTAERMLRVMVEALEVMSTDAPIVLVLEDLHWGDFSTLDLLSAVAQRREPARLMIVATYRPVDAIVQRHPVTDVKHSLELHDRCRVLAVELLSAADIFQYLRQRFAPDAFPESLAQMLYRHTDGNPLFLMAALQYLCAEGSIEQRDGVWQLTAPMDSVALGVPDTLRLMIERRYSQLTVEERTVLDAASVAGHVIAIPALAAALGQDSASIEVLCAGLARRGLFLQPLENRTWPDGTRTAQYRFIHALYEQTLYGRVATEQRRHWHQRIAERIEAAYRSRPEEVAAELAVHFENAGAHAKCVEYLEQAATNSLHRCADQEAIGYLEHAVQQLALLPDTPQRTDHELSVLIRLGGLQVTTLGYGSNVARDSYARLLALCRRKETQPQILPALGGLAIYHLNKAEFAEAQRFGEEMIAAAARFSLPAEVLAYSRLPLLLALYYRGQFNEVVACMQQGIELCDPTEYSRAPHVWSEPGVSMLSYLSIILLLRGQPDDAIKRSGQAIDRADALGGVGSIANAHCFAAVMNYFLRDWRKVEEHGAAAMKVAEENGLRFWQAQAVAIHGAGRAQLGAVAAGVESLRKGYSEMRAAGGIASGTYVHCMIAEAFMNAGRLDEADQELQQAAHLVESSGERFAQAEIDRNRGALLLLRAAAASAGQRKAPARRSAATPLLDAATGWFEKAIALAQSQGILWWELRATVSLCRVWQTRGRRREAQQRLTQVYARLPQTASTVDLRDAASLLAELTSHRDL